jgi:hypothetical protein
VPVECWHGMCSAAIHAIHLIFVQAVEVVKAARQKADSTELGVDLDLLQGRVLSSWRGHNGEALALYDELAEVRLALQPGSVRSCLAVAPSHACFVIVAGGSSLNEMSVPLHCRRTPPTSGRSWPRRSS